MFRLSLLFATLVSAASLMAQTPDTASIRGQVFDQTHAAVSGAEVKITNIRVGSKRSTHTDSSRHFSFSGLPVGSYSQALYAGSQRMA